MDRNLIIEKLKTWQPGQGPDRGDYQLNPGMSQSGDLVPAAVLVPLVERPDGITTMLTQRTNHLAHHPGQISFPGGHVDPGDGTPEETALRETEEEVGVHRRHIEIIGRLDELVETGFRGPESDAVLAMVDELNMIESDTDRMGLELSRSLFAHEDSMKPISVVLWYDLIKMIGSLADDAEKIGNRLRLLLAH